MTFTATDDSGWPPEADACERCRQSGGDGGVRLSSGPPGCHGGLGIVGSTGGQRPYWCPWIVIVVTPSGPLSGTVRAGGAKNSVLKLMAACLLAEGRHVLTNVPRISDVDIMAEVLGAMGAR